MGCVRACTAPRPTHARVTLLGGAALCEPACLHSGVPGTGLVEVSPAQGLGQLPGTRA